MNIFLNMNNQTMKIDIERRWVIDLRNEQNRTKSLKENGIMELRMVETEIIILTPIHN